MNILIDGQTLESPEVNRGIGVYFKNTLNNMVKQSFCHAWYITVSNEEALEALDPWVRQRLIPIVDPVFVPTDDYSRTKVYTNALLDVVKKQNIKLYWNPNPLMVNVLFPEQELPCRMACMVHDVIPAIMPVKEWTSIVRTEYFRRFKLLRRCQNLIVLCNSKATERDAKKYIGEQIQSTVTLLGADAQLFYQMRTAAGVNNPPYAVFTGGFDYRKNLDGAIQALAAAKKLYPEDEWMQELSLYIVCSCQPDQKERFMEKVASLGLEGFVTLSGYLSEQELRELYIHADLFFFPSLYEGFGLPIVEAMMGGAYVASADNSSLPEVCGEHAILFDANNVQDMAKALCRALHIAKNETVEQKQRRQQYALGFSWSKTAQETLTEFEKSVTPSTATFQGKYKLAWITPWPMQQTGIANFNYKLMPYLSEYFSIDIFVDRSIKSPSLLENHYGCLYPLKQLDTLAAQYDTLVYQFGNSSEFHTKIYKAFLKHPGIAEVHDFVLNPFFYHSYMLKGKGQKYKDALVVGYGEDGGRHYEDIVSGQSFPDNQKFPMCHTIINQAPLTIFHNMWSSFQVNDKRVAVVPHPSFQKVELTTERRKSAEETLSQKTGELTGKLVLGCFGFVNKNKRPQVTLAAVRALKKQGYPIKAVFYGKETDGEVTKMIEDQGLTQDAVVTGYLTNEEYEIAIEQCDIVINLRYPSMGEASGTLCEAFQSAKPVIVSDVNQYQEFPDDVCWKVGVGSTEETLLIEEIKYLLEHPRVRETLGKNAKGYADTVLSPAAIARQYHEIISAAIENRKEQAYEAHSNCHTVVRG